MGRKKADHSERKHLRLQNWDYRWPGAYFITICTKNRARFFGEILQNKMHLSHVGIIADICWHEIKNHHPDTELDTFQIMPDHIHGILILKSRNHMYQNAIEKSTEQGMTIGQKRFQNQGKSSVSSIIGSYKSAVTKYAHRLGYEFGWQSRFYEQIIHNRTMHAQISTYIKNNPHNSHIDKLFR